MDGIFITFEGPDGAGKTTQLRRLADMLRERGVDVLVTREPGGTPISDRIRNLVLDPDNREMDSRTEVLLYAASRAQHVHEVILPALAKGRVVLCDRYIDASIAYQAYGLGIGEEVIQGINRFASGGLQPLRTYLLDVPVEESLRRLHARAHASTGERLDRIEQRTFEYHSRVREGFLRIAARESGRVRRISADRPEEAIFTDIVEDIRTLLPQ